MFFHVFGICWYQHWGQIFLFTKSFCRIDQLIPQSHELVEIWVSRCEILDPKLVSFLDQGDGPNLFWHLPKSTKSVQVNLSREAVVLQAMGGRDRVLVA